MTPDEVLRLFAELAVAPVVSLPIEPHLPATLRLAIELRHPIYDCLYLAVALAHGTHVVPPIAGSLLLPQARIPAASGCSSQFSTFSPWIIACPPSQPSLAISML
jgi:hypothetical protein